MKHIIVTFIGILLNFQVMAQNTLPEISNLSLREKIAQLCIVAAISHEESNQDVIKFWANWEPRHCLNTSYIEKLIRDHGIGGVIFFGKHTLPQDQLLLTQHFQSLSRIPLLIALDAEKGLSSRFEKDSVLAFPYNMTLGAIQDSALTYQVGYEIGEQLKAVGVHLNFAPVVDVNNNPKNPIIGMRSFGSDKEIVAKLGIALMRGLQDAGIIACAKHFPGHGDTSVDSHETLPLIPHSRSRLEDIELYPFRKMISAGVQSVMLGHLEVPVLEPTKGLPASLSRKIATELLQDELGFNGLIVTDALGMKGVTNSFEPGQIELKALQAGADILLCPIDAAQAIDCIEQAVNEGVLSEREIDLKVRKVFQAKAWPLQNALKNAVDLNLRLHAPEAEALKREIYAKAITLVKSACESPFASSLQKTAVVNIGNPLMPFENIVNGIGPLLQVSLQNRLVSDDLKALEMVVESAEHVLITLQEEYPFAEEDDDPILSRLIQRIRALRKKVSVVLFCTPYRVEYVREADTIVLAYENDPDAQIAVGKWICGQSND